MKRFFEVVKDEFRVHPNIEVKKPERGDAGSCGYDFFSLEDAIIPVGEQHLFFTDIKASMPRNARLEINTRSGNGVKLGLVLANTIGYVDSTYFSNPTNDGNIGICLKNMGKKDVEICIGDRIAQGCFSKYQIVCDDKFKKFKFKKKKSARLGGFGSTGGMGKTVE